MTRSSISATLVLVLLASGAGAQADEVVIGASIPLSGPLAGFGMYQRWGYETAVRDLNKAGVLTIAGKKTTVRLLIRDDKTDPNVTASNTETLISRDKVIAMLGSCTPALVNAGALVAERGGLLRPSSGSLHVDGVDVTGWPPHRIARLGIAQCLERRRIFASLSVEENLLVPARGVAPSLRRERLEQVY